MKRQDITIEEVEFNKRVHKQTIKEVINWAIGLCDKIVNGKVLDNNKDNNVKESKKQDR